MRRNWHHLDYPRLILAARERGKRMQVRCTVVGPHGEVDVRITAPRGTPLCAVAAEVAALGGGSGPLFAGGRQLPGDAVVGVAPLVEGVRLSVRPDPAGSDDVADSLAVRVVGGPAAGDLYPVTPGRWRVGRGAGVDVPLDADPAVSRRHALIVVHAHGTVVRDTQSTNGSEVDGRPVESEGTTLTEDSRLRVGDSTLSVERPHEPPASVRASGDGLLRVNRPPRLDEPAPPVELALPTPPEPPKRARLPVAGTLLPLIIGGALAWWQPQFAMFMLLSPLMLAVNLLSDRLTGRRGHRRLMREYAEAVAASDARIEEELATESQHKRRASPDAARLRVMSARAEVGLWCRGSGDGDFLTVRLGTAALPAGLALRASGGAVRHPVLASTPLTVSLRQAGVLGLGGGEQRVDALARFIVGQLATLHSPRDLEVVVLTTRPAEIWSWARWLPHVQRSSGAPADVVGPDTDAIAARVARLLDRIDAAGSGRHDRASPRAVVVVLDDAEQVRTFPGVARLLAGGPAAGIHSICLTADPRDLPAECRATAVLTGASTAALRVAGAVETPADDAVADLVSYEWARRVARCLAPLRDATPVVADALPRTVSLLELLDLPEPAAEEIASRWLHRPRSTVAVIGQAATGPYSIDLRTDGPHGLIAGTTGAGKSQLLQTLVAALAVANRPDELIFVLVDYKGGAAFADCARLPHTAGVVTDLDAQLTARALSSLEAELRRRERILAAAGCPDLESYQRRGSPDGPLPRLVLAIDEFASLAEELPDFVAGLIDVARRGRSLGLHLLLATQRPHGVVSAEIRANTALRIALRVTDAGDSHDVIDTGQAATIDSTTPGRAYCRTSGAAPAQIQVAHLGVRAVAAGGTVTVERYDWTTPMTVGTGPATAGDRPTGLSTLVDAIGEAAESLQLARLHSPWLPPLPATLALGELTSSGAHRLAIGLRDLPASQAQRPYELDLAGGGHLIVAGGPRSGRTATLRSVAGAAGRLPVDDVHLYLLDCAGGGLLPAGELPHTGAAVGPDDAVRGVRVIDRLAAEVARRQALLASSGHGSLAEYRASCPSAERPPWLLLLIDGWDGLVTAYDEIDHGRPVETVLGLLRDGGAAGLRIVVTGGRGLLTGRLATLVPQRVVLPLSDPGDYALAGIDPRRLPGRARPGRGAVVGGDDVTEVQIALLHPDPAGAAQLRELHEVATAARRSLRTVPAPRLPWRVQPLPSEAWLETPALPQPRPLWAEVGAGGDDADRTGVDLGRFGPGFLVAGPRGSGRSTALMTIAASCAAYGSDVVVVARARSPLSALTSSGRDRHERLHGPFSPDDADALSATLLLCGGPVLAVVDDAAGLTDSPSESVLVDLLRSAATRPAAVALSGTVEELAGGYRGLIAEARRSGSGLLLCPGGPLAGDLLGIAVSRGHPPLPGRGILGLHGAATPVQVARLTTESGFTPCADSASRWAG